MEKEKIVKNNFTIFEEQPDDEEQAKEQYEKETGLPAMTTKGTLRKDYKKWKKNNWS